MAIKRRNKNNVKLDDSIRTNQVTNASAQFQVLNENQCERLYNAVLEVMENVGMEIHHKGAVELLRNAGCFVDDNGIRVKIPSHVVKKAIASSPSRIVLCDRNGKRKLFLEKNNAYFGPGPTLLNFIDVNTGERRPVVKNDVFDTAKVVDALPNIDFCMSLANINDCTSDLADVHEVHAMLQNTTKPVVTWAFNRQNLDTIIKMFEVIAGGEEELQMNPNVLIYSEPTTPFVHTYEAVDKLLYLAEKGLPQNYTPVVQAGATSPATRAGTIIVGAVDTLAGLVISQLKNPGTPFICGGVITNMDMKTTVICYGSPEFAIMHAATVDLFKYLNIPTFSTAGCTDSCVLDEQAGIDQTITIYTAALSGGNIIHDVGYMDSGMVGSLEALCMGDEIIGEVRSIMRGVRIDDEALGLDVIEKVGPGGHFLNEKHTMDNFRKEFWYPETIERNNYENWKNSGSLTYKQRLNIRAKKILAEHQPQKLSNDVLKQLDKLVEEAEKRCKK